VIRASDLGDVADVLEALANHIEKEEPYALNAIAELRAAADICRDYDGNESEIEGL